MKTRRTLLALVLSVMMVIGLFPVTAMADGEIVVTGSDTAWSNGQYVVNSDVTINNRVTVNGNVDLILADGYTLTVNGGINVREGNSLTISGTGTLTASSIATGLGNNNYAAAIGGNKGQNCGTITINGGTVNATAKSEYNNNYGAAIGGGGSYGGVGGSGGTITINGGTVNATSKSEYDNNYGAAIGGGDYGSGGTITINGGIVNAEASSSSSNQAAAIGGGNSGSCGIITISGGEVTAKASGVNNNAAAIGRSIGGSLGGNDGKITISGGTVNATATATAESSNRSPAIGGTDVTITIDGGTVTATAQSVNGINNGAAIGGEDNGSVGTITIRGGTVNATTLGNSNCGAAIGGGAGKSSGKITISGGTVTATATATQWSFTGAAIGGGYGYSGSAGSFSTNEDEKNGSAVIFASTTSDKPAISDQSQKGNWSGIIFEGTNSGTVYGNPIITEDAEIPAGYTLEVPSEKTVTIAEGATLTIAEGATLANNGTVDIKGTVDGNISGTGKLSCPVSITATNLTYTGNTNTTNENDYTVTFTAAEGYTLPESVTVKVGGTTLTQGNYTFANGTGTLTIPKEKITGNIEITASGILQSYLLTVENGGEGATVSGNYDYGATVTLSAGTKDGYTFAGWTSEDVEISAEGTFTMPAKDVTVTSTWTEIPVEPGQPETPSEPEYIPIPAPDYPAPVYRNTWHKSGKNWYFYDEDGQKVKGWYKDGNTWYYLSEKTGAMVYGGMLEIDGETYYFYDWGGMASGWWYYDETDGSWYYFRGSGAMAKSAWVEWKGEWYYLGADGKMLTGTTTPDGYRVDANGKWIR